MIRYDSDGVLIPNPYLDTFHKNLVQSIENIFDQTIINNNTVNKFKKQVTANVFFAPKKHQDELFIHTIRNDAEPKKSNDNIIKSYNQLQHSTQIQAENLKQQIERLQSQLQTKLKQVRSERKSIGLKPNVEKLFVNRIEYLDKLTKYIIDKDTRLILIVGQGGIGKTFLAAKFCSDIEKANYQIPLFNNPQTNQNHAPIRTIVYVNQREMFSLTLQDIFDKLMQTLDNEDFERINKKIREQQVSVIIKTSLLLDCLQNGITIIVLDNFESILSKTKISDPDLQNFIEIICETQNNLKIIITSRVNLEIDTFAMKTITLDKGFNTKDSILFFKKLAATGIEQITNTTDEELKQLSKKVFGIPMALRTLASFLKNHRCFNIKDLIRDNSLFDDFIEYDFIKGLRKLIKEQYENLPDDAKLVLQIFAVYNAPIKPVAVQFILPALNVKYIIDALVYKYFCIQEQNQYFEIHPIIQEYAYSQIPEDFDDSPYKNSFNKKILHTRAADFYAQLITPKNEWKTITDLQPHLDEFDHRIKANQYDYAAQLVDRIDFNYLQLWGYYRQVISMREMLVYNLSDSAMKLNNLNFLGCAYMKTMEMSKAKYYLEKGIEIACEAGEKITVRHFPGNLGRVLLELGEFHEAKKMFKQMIIAKPNRLSLEALWIGLLGQALRGIGEYKKAIKCFEIALEKSQSANDNRWQINHLTHLADVLSDTGNTTTALKLLQQATVLAEKTNNRYGQAFCYFHIGKINHQLGNNSIAQKKYKKALLLDIPLIKYKSFIYLAVTNLYHYDKSKESREYFTQGKRFCQELLKKTPYLYDVIFCLSIAELAIGDIKDAIVNLEMALNICSEKGVLSRFNGDLLLVKKGFNNAGLIYKSEACERMTKIIKEKRKIQFSEQSRKWDIFEYQP